jgi:hypothetical protein
MVFQEHVGYQAAQLKGLNHFSEMNQVAGPFSEQDSLGQAIRGICIEGLAWTANQQVRTSIVRASHS